MKIKAGHTIFQQPNLCIGLWLSLTSSNLSSSIRTFRLRNPQFKRIILLIYSLAVILLILYKLRTTQPQRQALHSSCELDTLSGRAKGVQKKGTRVKIRPFLDNWEDHS